MRRWVAMSLNRFTFQVCSASSKRECLGWVCLLDRGNLAACGHWWHLCVHFQDVLGKPSRRMLWYRQKWSFRKASDETVKWLDRRERMRELRRHYTEIFLSFSLTLLYRKKTEFWVQQCQKHNTHDLNQLVRKRKQRNWWSCNSSCQLKKCPWYDLQGNWVVQLQRNSAHSWCFYWTWFLSSIYIHWKCSIYLLFLSSLVKCPGDASNFDTWHLGSCSVSHQQLISPCYIDI